MSELIDNLNWALDFAQSGRVPDKKSIDAIHQAKMRLISMHDREDRLLEVLKRFSHFAEEHSAHRANLVMNGKWGDSSLTLNQEQIDRALELDEMRNVALTEARAIIKELTND